MRSATVVAIYNFDGNDPLEVRRGASASAPASALATMTREISEDCTYLVDIGISIGIGTGIGFSYNDPWNQQELYILRYFIPSGLSMGQRDW
jgi:hypothetical protein